MTDLGWKKVSPANRRAEDRNSALVHGLRQEFLRHHSHTSRGRCAFALPSLCLRSRFASISGPAATPKRLFNGVGYAPRYSYSATVPFTPNRSLGLGNALRNSYSVTVPFPHCTTQPQSVILNCNNCNVTPAPDEQPDKSGKDNLPEKHFKITLK